MKSLPIPESEQIDAMLNNSFYELVSDYVENPSLYNLKQYITINRKKMLDFFTKNPSRPTIYFKEHEKSHDQVIHDVYKILRNDAHYMVAWMDHGQPRWPKPFDTLAEAVTEYLFVSYDD